MTSGRSDSMLIRGVRCGPRPFHAVVEGAVFGFDVVITCKEEVGGSIDWHHFHHRAKSRRCRIWRCCQQDTTKQCRRFVVTQDIQIFVIEEDSKLKLHNISWTVLYCFFVLYLIIVDQISRYPLPVHEPRKLAASFVNAVTVHIEDGHGGIARNGAFSLLSSLQRMLPQVLACIGALCMKKGSEACHFIR